MADHSIKGKTVLITGGAKNLGGLIARDLASHGAKAIAIHYNSAASKADADATVAALQAAGAKAVALQATSPARRPWKSCSPTPWPRSASRTSRSIPWARC